ncbi:uncharacterized protein LOC122048880 [Zingiber officinale]|uniref:uncharacterized protein LOC122048880 n=1 Tax=Zingiber officinale TaxID=94328 RepID=UPI001C4BD8F3|nr:uncharacterized protein LOC122048880 [Zingiber officinale]
MVGSLRGARPQLPAAGLPPGNSSLVEALNGEFVAVGSTSVPAPAITSLDSESTVRSCGKDFDRDERRDEIDVGFNLHLEVADSDPSTLGGGSRLPVPRYFRGRFYDFGFHFVLS